MTDNEDEGRIHRGLKDVYFERSPTTFIDGRAGDLRYRGYSIHDLARHSTFEETSYLLLRGELPTQSQLDEFDKELKAARKLPDEILDLIATVKAAHPMDVLRTAVSALAETAVLSTSMGWDDAVSLMISKMSPDATRPAFNCSSKSRRWV